jgi:hypothetical protein
MTESLAWAKLHEQVCAIWGVDISFFGRRRLVCLLRVKFSAGAARSGALLGIAACGSANIRLGVQPLHEATGSTGSAQCRVLAKRFALVGCVRGDCWWLRTPDGVVFDCRGGLRRAQSMGVVHFSEVRRWSAALHAVPFHFGSDAWRLAVLDALRRLAKRWPPRAGTMEGECQPLNRMAIFERTGEAGLGLGRGRKRWF